LDGKQEKCIGQLFAGGIEVDSLTQLDGLTDRGAIARPQLDGLHGAPPLDAQDTILRRLSTFPQRSYHEIRVRRESAMEECRKT
jgi:hypothetical protein